MGRIAKVAKQRSNSYIIIYYRETDLQNCESCEATQQFVYHYIYYRETNIENCGNCEAMKQFVYHYYTTGKQICRIAKVAKQRSNSYIIITLQGNKFAELRELRSNAAIRISLYTSGGFI